MEKILNIFKSRTTWTLIALFVVNGISGIHDLIPPSVLPFVDAILTMAGIYFRVVPKQNFN